MRTVILAGGKGTRLNADRPKPMVEVGGIPMLTHIMNIYKKCGFNDFIIATGYKGEYIRDYYKDFPNIMCLDTGLEGGTAHRIRECAMHIEEEYFFVSYGDSPADVNINALLHAASGPVTLTAVHPPPRYGGLVIKGNKVIEFVEKKANTKDWINGGFFVVNTEFAASCKDTWWEFDTLPKLAKSGDLHVYKHPGFWLSMDTQKDVDYLNELWNKGEASWA